MKKKTIVLLLVVLLTLTGCTKNFRDETTNKAYTQNILCQPETKEVRKIYEDNADKIKIDLDKLPKCKKMKITSGGYEGLWTSLFVKPLAFIIIKLGLLLKKYGLSIIVLSFIKKLSIKDLLLLFDCLVVVVPIWIILWRFGNYLNQELYWLVVPEWAWWLSNWLVSLLTNLNIFHVYPKIDLLLRVNTNFISIFFEWIVLFLLIFFVSRKQVKSNNIKVWLNSSVFLIFYSLFRFLIEYLRVDSQSQFLWIFTTSQWLFLWLFLIWIIWFVSLEKKNK